MLSFSTLKYWHFSWFDENFEIGNATTPACRWTLVVLQILIPKKKKKKKKKIGKNCSNRTQQKAKQERAFHWQRITKRKQEQLMKNKNNHCTLAEEACFLLEGGVVHFSILTQGEKAMGEIQHIQLTIFHHLPQTRLNLHIMEIQIDFHNWGSQNMSAKHKRTRVNHTCTSITNCVLVLT